MNHTAINLLLFIFLLQPVSALSFSINSPASATTEEEFNVSISFDEAREDYDVKIYINNDAKEFSEIFYDNAWKSPFKYIISAFPSKKVFLIKSHVTGEAQLCVQLRESGKKTFNKLCNPIDILQPGQRVQDKIEGEGDSQEISDANAANSEKPIENLALSIGQTNNISYEREEKISLNSRKISETDNISMFITSREKTRLFMLYAFAFFCLIVIVFLSLKKL